MSSRTLSMTDKIHEYMLAVSVSETDVQRKLREATATMAQANMQISPEQGQLLQLLVRMLGAKRCLEVGTFTGYSSLAVALALPDDGIITACDVSEEWTNIAMKHWREAGVAHKVYLRLAPAIDTLDQLLSVQQAGQYDFAFIDADKENYLAYFERCLKLIRSGGLIAVDNTLWYGHPTNPEKQDPDTVAIRAFNRALKSDSRVRISLVPIGDGLTLALKL